MLGLCDCCRILDQDWRVKLVTFCNLCGAWLCDACKNNPLRRARAAAKTLRKK